MFKQIIAANVCQALPLGVDMLMSNGTRQKSRAGDVIVANGPVLTQYTKPWQRVLTNRVRDANPFFHLAEAMWMLAGRHDADFLNQFVHDFGLRFAEDGLLRASYGYRWRKHFGIDQLSYIIKRLKDDPNDRRIVLSMWDGHEDLVPNAESHVQRDGRKDIPCNTHVYFRVNDGKLDMTVCCRSNDIIWGAYGANAVHFSFLQEYIACHLEIEMGCYYQFSNNYHAYMDEIDKLAAKSKRPLFYSLQDDVYNQPVLLYPLVSDLESFDEELQMALNCEPSCYRNKFLSEVLIPALEAHRSYKKNEEVEGLIFADDWRIACMEWISRRREKRNASQTTQDVVVA